MKLSKISLLHYIKLGCRSLLFLSATIIYLYFRLTDKEVSISNLELTLVFAIIWLLYFLEMILRFFPSNFESMGCQKQFARNYEPIHEGAKPVNQSGWVTALVAGIWLALNGVFGLLYFLGVFDAGILILIALGFSVCDIICILFFCPFQTWFMKNRCCATCRIYNWDYAMMFTPLVFIPHIYTYSLLGCALLLLLRWEITYRRHPERFSTATNRCLDCSRCEEKLCSHKTQLRSFIKKYKDRFFGSDPK